MLRLSLLLICLLGCLGLSAQSNEKPSTLHFDAVEWNFGQIPEDGGLVHHRFVGINRTDSPIVILDIASSCGCTVPKFTRKPIMPGEKLDIDVSFDPMHRPGDTHKELDVYDSQRRRIARLHVTGYVQPRKLSVEEMYPVDLGYGVRLSSNSVFFSSVEAEKLKQSVVQVINTSPKSISLNLSPIESSGFLSVDYPRVLPSGESAQITLSYKIPNQGEFYGSLQDLFSIRIDDKLSRLKLSSHGVGVDNTDLMPDDQEPRVKLSTLIMRFGAVKRSAQMAKRSISIENNGAGELRVRKIELPSGYTLLSPKIERLSPGQSANIEVGVDPKALDYGVQTARMLIITNDPNRPTYQVRLVVEILD